MPKAMALLGSVAVAIGFVAMPASAATRTHTHIYEAFTASGQPAITVTRTVSGTATVGPWLSTEMTLRVASRATSSMTLASALRSQRESSCALRRPGSDLE